MRYGNVPVVRKTGGLADTVYEGKNGFVFEHRSTKEFSAAVGRAVTAFRNPPKWKKIVATGMTGDYSWSKSAGAYVQMFHDAIKLRLAEPRDSQGVAS